MSALTKSCTTEDNSVSCSPSWATTATAREHESEHEEMRQISDELLRGLDASVTQYDSALLHNLIYNVRTDSIKKQMDACHVVSEAEMMRIDARLHDARREVLLRDFSAHINHFFGTVPGLINSASSSGSSGATGTGTGRGRDAYDVLNSANQLVHVIELLFAEFEYNESVIDRVFLTLRKCLTHYAISHNNNNNNNNSSNNSNHTQVEYAFPAPPPSDKSLPVATPKGKQVNHSGGAGNHHQQQQQQTRTVAVLDLPSDGANHTNLPSRLLLSNAVDVTSDSDASDGERTPGKEKKKLSSIFRITKSKKDSFYGGSKTAEKEGNGSTQKMTTEEAERQERHMLSAFTRTLSNK